VATGTDDLGPAIEDLKRELRDAEAAISPRHLKNISAYRVVSKPS